MRRKYRIRPIWATTSREFINPRLNLFPPLPLNPWCIAESANYMIVALWKITLNLADWQKATDIAARASGRAVIMMPDIIQRLRDAYAENPAKALDLLPELFQAADERKIVELDEHTALAISAGASLIERSKQYEHGATYVYDVFGDSKEIPYRIAADALREIAEKALKERET
jgi:hypothetical protein